ncbi:hypothetical protein MmiHf6_07080 [Methanimicrococcus hongohii]|uniref:Uncharacterized protein n=1 Tax=Methanimicrococcus hongohii TaxID=3028295 RepID=A0AA96V8H0_9EURY|nr:DUF1877 family protein [Methanimicrococcus sp. Hf6]WNY23401.1 hypothetical protein MmiHf6_07080 [Methanimicrococcus sp. Hf6]
MIIVFAAVSKQQIRDFENGDIDKDQFIDILINSERIELSQIDRAINVLADDDEFSEYWEIVGGGEILAGGDGSALVIDPILFIDEENDSSDGGDGSDNGGGFQIMDPAVYMTNDEIKKGAAILETIDKEQFKDAFDSKIKKLTKRSFLSKKKQALKESAGDIFEMLWNEIAVLRSFYEKVNDGENHAVIFSIYENEDFE